MVISQEKIDAYLKDIYTEMKNRGFQADEIPRIIEEPGFMRALEKYPEGQLYYEISDAVDEIIETAARSYTFY